MISDDPSLLDSLPLAAVGCLPGEGYIYLSRPSVCWRNAASLAMTSIIAKQCPTKQMNHVQRDPC